MTNKRDLTGEKLCLETDNVKSMDNYSAGHHLDCNQTGDNPSHSAKLFPNSQHTQTMT